jgi:hypothetical protein
MGAFTGFHQEVFEALQPARRAAGDLDELDL